MAGKFEVKAFSGRRAILYSETGGKSKIQLLRRIICVRDSVLTNLVWLDEEFSISHCVTVARSDVLWEAEERLAYIACPHTLTISLVNRDSQA